MKQRIITGVLFTISVALFVVPGIWHPVFPMAMLVIVTIWSGSELAQAFHACGLYPSRAAILSGVLLVPLAGFLRLSNLPLAAALSIMAGLLFFLVMFVCLYMLIHRGPECLPTAALSSGLLLYLNVPVVMASLTLLFLEHGWLWFTLGLVSPWLSDVFAYFTGSALGRHKIVPKISPKKSVEGFFGGLAGTMLVLGPAFFLLRDTFAVDNQLTGWHVGFGLAAAMLLSLASQLGDWLASGLKRWCKIKDFGHFLPGHGGMMDRFDSALLTLPLALVLAVIHQQLF